MALGSLVKVAITAEDFFGVLGSANGMFNHNRFGYGMVAMFTTDQ